MMSLESIIALNERIAAEAAEEGLVPFVPGSPEAIDLYPPFPFPNLGYLIPKGWEKTDDSWFVDKTGWGRDDEHALSVEQFKRVLRSYIAEHPEHGLAITEEGEFQLYVSAFRPKRQAKKAA